MAGERLRALLPWFLALMACAPLVRLSPTAAGGAEGAPARHAAEGVLVLTGGDRLRGTLLRGDDPGAIVWRSPAFVEPLHFPLTSMQVIKFDSPTTATHGEYRIELPGGDELHGTLVSLDKSSISVGTKWGTWRVKRSAVASVSHLHRALRRRAKSPATEKPAAQQAHVVLATNKTVYAELLRYDARSTAFSFQGQDAAVTYRANDIAEIVFANAGPNGDPLRLECSEGTRLSGELVKISDGNMVLKSSSLLDTITVPLAGLRSVHASAPGKSPSRDRGEGLFVCREDRLRGRLVAAEPKAGQTPFAWQPSGSSRAVTIRADIAAVIDFDPAAQAAAIDDLSPAEDRIFLQGGDVLQCRIATIDAEEIVLQMAGSALKQVPNSRIKAVELGPHSRGVIAEDKLARLLTVPRLQKNDPPTHVLSSLAGDYLRGRLVEMNENRVWFEVGATRREFPRDRIASIVWLDANGEAASDSNGEPAKDKHAASMVHVTDADGLSLNLTSSRLDGEAIVGRSQLLGDCRFPLDRLSAVRLGPETAHAKPARRYVAWKLTSAVEPKAFSQDDGEGRQAGETDLVGQPAPPFALTLLDGSRFVLSAQRGKVVVLDFWASWCAPCIKGLPQAAAVAGEFDSDQVRFIAVNVQQQSEEAAQAAARLKLNVPVALDLNGRVAASYGATSIPYTVVVGADGKYFRVLAGYGPRLTEDLKGAIADALAEK